MADNKMNNPEHEKNVGGRTSNEGQQGQEGQKAPGRNLNDDQSTSQCGGSQGTERKGQGQGGGSQSGSQGGSQGGQKR